MRYDTLPQLAPFAWLPEVRRDHTWLLAVEDDGSGIDPAMRETSLNASLEQTRRTAGRSDSPAVTAMVRASRWNCLVTETGQPALAQLEGPDAHRARHDSEQDLWLLEGDSYAAASACGVSITTPRHRRRAYDNGSHPPQHRPGSGPPGPRRHGDDHRAEPRPDPLIALDWCEILATVTRR
jgi:hypothetical protein